MTRKQCRGAPNLLTLAGSITFAIPGSNLNAIQQYRAGSITMKQFQISDAEWEIMKVLWEHPPATVNEISEMLTDSRGWHPKTVRTMLNRLVKKGAVDNKIEENVYHYFPLHKKEDYVSQASDSFIDRVFDGAFAPMVAHFAKSRLITKKEKEEHKRILNEDV